MESTRKFNAELKKCLESELKNNKGLSAKQRKHMEGVIADIDKQNSTLKKEKPSIREEMTA